MLDERERARDRRGGHVQDVRARRSVRRLRVQRGALAHAEAVLLVDDGDREPREVDVLLDQRVRADDEAQLAASRACRARRRGGRPASSRSAARPAPPRPASAPGSSRSAARRASRSAPSARACQPCSTARSSAYSATTVLPEPTSPISRRCIGRAAARSRVDRRSIARCLVAGRRERQRRREPARGQLARAVERRRARAALARRARRRSSASWSSSSSSNASRRRPPSASLLVAGEVQRAPARRRGRAAARRRAGARAAARACRRSRRGARAPARGCGVESIPSLAGYWRDLRRRRRPAGSVGACAGDAEARCGALGRAPCSSRRVPGG